jgi:Flp pilus assembly protein TadB
MNKKQKWQVSLAAFIVVFTIVWLFFPGWKATKILGILSGVFTVIALYLSYRAEEKNKKDSF